MIPRPQAQVLLLMAAIMAGFGIVVAAAAVGARIRHASVRPLVTKYLAWFLIIPPILLPLVFSARAFAAVMLLLSLACLREFSRVTGLCGDRGMMRLGYVLTAGMYVPVLAGWSGIHELLPLAAIAVLVLAPIVRGRYEQMLQKVSLSILGVLYFGWFPSFLACLRAGEHGVSGAFFLMALVACNDAFASLWGRLLGRHKLAPRISPNKTVEGAVLAAASVLLVGYLMRGLLPAVGTAAVLLLAATVALLGTAGDLVISFIKRDVGVKDMGAAIPGHGGILDRMDSLIIAAPAFFHLLRGLHGV